MKLSRGSLYVILIALLILLIGVVQVIARAMSTHDSARVRAHVHATSVEMGAPHPRESRRSF